VYSISTGLQPVPLYAPDVAVYAALKHLIHGDVVADAGDMGSDPRIRQ
jgi:hypothetical protein